jgi:methionyl-tRNA formyltransferase
VLHGDEITGACVFELEEGLDTGPVYGTLTDQIRAHDTAGDLLERLAASGAGLLVAVLDGIEDGTARAVPQPLDGVSLAPKITVEDAHVRWTDPAFAVDRRIRACTPTPGAWSTFREERVKLGPVRLIAGGPELDPGDLLVERSRVLVGTATTPVALGEVRAAGKKAMAAGDWARGLRPQPGERLT